MGIVGYMRGTAYRRGVVGSSKGWFAFWVGLAIANWLRRHTGRGEDRVLRFEIAPGQKYLLTHEPRPEKVRRRDRRSGG